MNTFYYYNGELEVLLPPSVQYNIGCHCTVLIKNEAKKSGVNTETIFF